MISAVNFRMKGWSPMRSPDNAYKHFMENREELRKFNT